MEGSKPSKSKNATWFDHHLPLFSFFPKKNDKSKKLVDWHYYFFLARLAIRRLVGKSIPSFWASEPAFMETLRESLQKVWKEMTRCPYLPTHLVEVFHDFDVSRNRHWRLICPLENKDVVDKKTPSAALDIVVQYHFYINQSWKPKK